MEALDNQGPYPSSSIRRASQYGKYSVEKITTSIRLDLQLTGEILQIVAGPLGWHKNGTESKPNNKERIFRRAMIIESLMLDALEKFGTKT